MAIEDKFPVYSGEGNRIVILSEKRTLKTESKIQGYIIVTRADGTEAKEKVFSQKEFVEGYFRIARALEKKKYDVCHKERGGNLVSLTHEESSKLKKLS